MAEDESGARLCLVCRDKSDSAHFGVDSCRACAAFFRRTVSFNKVYVCRQNNERCGILHAKLACRRCRYLRCVEIGMHPKNVHTKLKKKEEKASSDDKPQPTRQSSSTSENEVHSDIAPSPRRTSSDISSLQRATPAATPLLKQLGEQYRILLAVRRSCEHMLRIQAQGVNARLTKDLIIHSRMSGQDRFFPATVGHLGRTVRGTVQAYIDFAIVCFPEMQEFDDQVKWILLKSFKRCVFIFEGVYRAKKFMPDNGRVVMMTSTTYLDVDNLDYYLSDAGDIHDVEHTKKMCRELTAQSMLLWLGPLLDKAQLTDVEAIAIVGLLFWPSYLEKASKRLIEVSILHQLRIFDELQAYYRNVLCLDDYSTRIAHITAVVGSVRGIMQRLKDNMEIYRLINSFESTDLLYSVIQE